MTVVLLSLSEVSRELGDLKGDVPEARREALLSLAQAEPDLSRAASVTAALAPLLFEGDVRGDLSPDLVARAYLHWASPDNVPDLIRLLQSSAIRKVETGTAGLVMQTLGKLQDPRAIDPLAEKLADPALRAGAADALRLVGPRAEPALLSLAFDGDTSTRGEALHLLAELGLRPTRIAEEALRHLRSSTPVARRSAAVWLAENPPDDPSQQAQVAGALSGMLDDLSPEANALALRALKLWATRDCLPQLVALATREAKGGTCSADLIDVLARFPDETAAEAIALQLESPANRGRAAQALLKLGQVATRAVLRYINSPEEAVQKEARELCRQLGVPTSALLDQALLDVADPQKPRARSALLFLVQLRPDDADRPRVSRALNAALLDPDPAVVADALNAVRVWGSRASTATLLNLLARLRPEGAARDPRVLELLGSLQDPAAAPALAEGLTRPDELGTVVKALVALGPGAEDAVVPYLRSTSREARFAACWVLGEIGTSKSLPSLEAAGYKGQDGAFFERTRLASEKIEARKG
jgi:hypothetical protein